MLRHLVSCVLQIVKLSRLLTKMFDEEFEINEIKYNTNDMVGFNSQD